MVGNNVKDSLNAYGRRKRGEMMSEMIKNATQTSRDKFADDSSTIRLLSETEDVKDDESTCSNDSVEQSQCTIIKVVIYVLYFLLWAILYIIAIEYEFGTVYFILSMLIFIALNTRSRPKKPGELSAYSVFNPDCKAIEGTIDASQFEREIRYGIGSVHYSN